MSTPPEVSASRGLFYRIFTGQQFDGVVTGKYGHTFVPFSGKSGGASGSSGDHDRLPQGSAFRIIVHALKFPS